jgi:hypothetical protein
MEIDLRQEMIDLIEKRGHWFVLRQSFPGRKCQCVNPVTGDSSKDCNTCFGSGRAFIDRFVKGRKTSRTGYKQGGAPEARTPIGLASSPDAVFYVQYDQKPSQTDYVLEIALDPNDQEPVRSYKILSVFDIEEAVEFRDQGGRIEFCSLFANRMPWHQFKSTELYDPAHYPDSLL